MNLYSIVYVFLVIYFTAISIESLYSYYGGRGFYDFRDTVVNLSLGALAILLRVLTKGLWLTLWVFLYQFAPLKISQSATSWVLLFVLNEFVYYWFHRISHESRLLWAVHVNHHSSEKMNFSNAARVPFLNILLHNIFWIPLLVVGFSPIMIFTIETVGFLFAFIQHTQVIGRLPVFELVFNTPSHHRVHHASNPEYVNKNYGNVLIIFDRLFGTFKDEERGIRTRYGLANNIQTYNIAKVIFHEWWDILKSGAAKEKGCFTIKQAILKPMYCSIRLRRKIFRLLQIAFTIAAIYHLVGLFYRVDTAPVTRHAIFVVSDLLCAYGFVKRPKYFVFFFMAFTIQQYNAHGQYLIHMWLNEERIHLVSILVLILMPIGLICLVMEFIHGSREGNTLIHRA